MGSLKVSCQLDWTEVSKVYTPSALDGSVHFLYHILVQPVLHVAPGMTGLTLRNMELYASTGIDKAWLRSESAQDQHSMYGSNL